MPKQHSETVASTRKPRVRGNQVEVPVLIQVCYENILRPAVLADGKSCRSVESSISQSDQNTHAMTGVLYRVGEDEVQSTIFIEVTGGDRREVGANRKTGSGSKSSFAIA